MKKMLDIKVKCTACAADLLNDENLERSTIRTEPPMDTRTVSIKNTEKKYRKNTRVVSLF